MAYSILGSSTIYRSPDTAAAAFYWATRLDPSRAEDYYGRAVALLRTLMEPYGPTSIWVPKRRLHENESEVVDSLHRLAYNLNPFFHRGYDRLLRPRTVVLSCDRVRDVRSAGLCFLQNNDYVNAVRSLGNALKRKPEDIDLHYLRAQLFFRLFQFDSAAAELGVLTDSLENRQTKKVMVYVSRAAIFFAQGLSYTEHGDTAKAREAYERALGEDLSFHMASVRLAGHALATGDTTAASSHLAHAVGVRPMDVAVRLYYGMVLSFLNRHREAAEQYMRAIEINPHYSPPYFYLAKLLERSDLEGAIASYHAYLAGAPRRESTRTWVKQRLDQLAASR